MAAAKWSQGTALTLMKNLVVLKVAQLVVPTEEEAKGFIGQQQSKRIKLADEFAWLIEQ